MRYHRNDVVSRALMVLDEYGLELLTMRRLAAELGIQPSALYHHLPNKQTLLAAVADEILLRGRRPREALAWDALDWDRRVVEICCELRDAMLAYRDGAEVVVAAHTFGLGAREPAEQLREALRGAGLPEDMVGIGTRAVLHLVFGHTVEEQLAVQAASTGVIDREPGGPADFELGLDVLMDGLRSRVAGR